MTDIHAELNTRFYEEMWNRFDKSIFARLSYTGTHHGEVFGIAPTGRRFEYAGAAVFDFTDNRISEVWVLGDIYRLLQQLTES